jgi:hypothetical protein
MIITPVTSYPLQFDLHEGLNYLFVPLVKLLGQSVKP